MPDVAGVHDDEAVDELVLARPGVVARLRSDLVVSTQLGITRRAPAGRPSLRAAASSSRRSRRPGRRGGGTTPTSRRKRADGRPGSRAASSRTADLGEDVLADDDERRAEATRDDEPDVADHRRVGHAEDEIRAARRAAPSARVSAEVGDVVRGPAVELRAVVRRRADADDRTPFRVSSARQVLVTAQDACDDRDVVVSASASQSSVSS